MARKKKQSFKDLVKLWVKLFDEHQLLTSATAIGLRVLVAMVALALLAVALLGETGNEQVWNDRIAPQIEPKVLPAVFSAIDATVQKIFSSSSVGLIVFASILAIWMVAGAVRACMSAFSVIEDTQDDRPWYLRFPLSLGISVVVTTAIVGAALLILGLRHAVHGDWGLPFAFVRWIGTILLLTFAFGVLVRWAPAEPRSKRWASGGAALVVVLWIAQSLLFAWYIRSLGNYKTAVGSLLLFYVFTTYAYIGGIVLLVGIELDEQLRRDVAGEEDRGILQIVREVF